MFSGFQLVFSYELLTWRLLTRSLASIQSSQPGKNPTEIPEGPELNLFAGICKNPPFGFSRTEQF
jgi:hypothetical protein